MEDIEEFRTIRIAMPTSILREKVQELGITEEQFIENFDEKGKEIGVQLAKQIYNPTEDDLFKEKAYEQELSKKYPNGEIDFKKMKESLNDMLPFKNFVMKEEVDE